MNENNLLRVTFFSVMAGFALIVVVLLMMSMPVRSKAAQNTLTLRIAVQGSHKNQDTLRAKIDLHTVREKKYMFTDIPFLYKDGAFSGDIALKGDFDYADFYAIYIKPNKYTGRIFCSKDSTGTSCLSPEFYFSQSGSLIDLTAHLFLSGDIPPANGKVDAADMSLIMKQLGKTGSDAPTDINNDGITNVTDYSLALYALSHNGADEEIKLISSGVLPSPTSQPSLSPALSPTPTTQPTNSPSSTTSPTATTTPTATPSPTTSPTATTEPTPTSAAATCHFTMPAGEGEPFDLKAGETSPCVCKDYMGLTTICATVTCKTCPSGICNCTIGQNMPPYTSNCTNDGSFSVNKLPQCN
jgi:hypothetical protein